MPSRNKHPRVSLFSFQDIITATTAIFLLITLSLSLQIQNIPSALPPEAVGESIRHAEETLKELQVLLDDETLDAPDINDASPPVPANTASPAEISALQARLQRAKDALRKSQEVQQQAVDQAAAEELKSRQNEGLLKDAIRDEALAKKLSAETQDIDQQNAELDGAIEKLQASIPPKRTGTRLLLRTPLDNSKRLWLLEITDTTCSRIQLGSNGGPITLKLGNARSRSAVQTWVNSLAPDRNHVLLLTRPSGIEQLPFIRDLLSNARVPHGLDFVAEDQPIYTAE